MPCMPNLVRKTYMQLGTYKKKPIVVVEPDVLLHFLGLTLPYCSKNTSMPQPPRVLQENSKCPRLCERERESSKLKLTKVYQLILYFINEAYNLFNFLYFPSFSSLHANCDHSPSFYPNFHSFHK